jgi:FkbM family methyltransferase
MPARLPKFYERAFRLMRRLARGSAGLRTKSAVKLALDVLEANGVAEITVRDRAGFDIRLLTGDKTITAGVLSKGHYTAEVMAALMRAMREHAVDAQGLLFVNVGANIGTTCLNAYASGFRRIVAVEPDADNFRLLGQNLAQLRDAELRLFNAAAGASRGTATLYRHRSNYGGHSLRPQAARSAGATAEVEVLPLSDIVPAAEPFALMLDVEGFEAEVLRGARELILARCRAIALELAPSRYSDADRRFLAEFAQAFAPAYLHVPSGQWRPAATLADMMETQRKGYADVILVSRSPPPG